MADRAETLATLETAFAQRLAASEFDDEADYQAASMPPAGRTALEAQHHELAQRRTTLDALQAQTSKELERERSKALTAAAADELEPQAGRGQTRQVRGRSGGWKS